MTEENNLEEKNKIKTNMMEEETIEITARKKMKIEKQLIIMVNKVKKDLRGEITEEIT